MRAVQPRKLCKPRRKARMKAGTRKTGLNPTAIITGHPKAILLLRFHLLYVRCLSIFKCYNFNTPVSNLFNSVKVTELPPV